RVAVRRVPLVARRARAGGSGDVAARSPADPRRGSLECGSVMTRNLKVGLGTTGVLGLFGVSSWRLGSLLGLHGPALWILRGGLILIACIAAAVIVWILLHRPPAPPKGSDPSAELDAAVAA